MSRPSEGRPEPGPLERFGVIGLDDLLRIERHIDRPTDRKSLRQLEAITRLREKEGLR